MKSKYSPEDIQRWATKSQSMTLKEVAKSEGLTPGCVIGALKRAGFCAPRKAAVRTKNKEVKDSLTTFVGARKPSRPDVRRPEIDGPTLMELKNDQCKFPVTHDRPHKFCGAHKTNGPYCQRHTELTTDTFSANNRSADNVKKWIDSVRY